MPNLKGVKTDKITIRLPEETIAELDELASGSGLYRASFFGVALVSGARSMAQRLEPSLANRAEQEPEKQNSIPEHVQVRAELAASDSPAGRIRGIAAMVASIATRMAEGRSGMFPTDDGTDLRGADDLQQLRLLKWQFDHLMVGINQMQKQFDETSKEQASN